MAERRGVADDCFALPPGQYWTPVDDALAVLAERLRPVAGTEELPLAEAGGRIPAEPVCAPWDVPRRANAAVDGYAYAAASLAGHDGNRLRLAEGRAAAGHDWPGELAAGTALRILTGAAVPTGADTVVLQEDVEPENGGIRVLRVPRVRANVREPGEDIGAGEEAVGMGRRLRPQDLAQLASVGVETLLVHRRLRVGVLSTGDEIRETGAWLDPDTIADANRPMLRALLDLQGFEVRDLGIVGDDAPAIRGILDGAVDSCDAIVTSGGASAGDEDHVSRLLNEAGALHVWRVAVKPGRPLIMGNWRGVPVFGLPGNPVAVFVCFLMFTLPSLMRLAGADWITPRRYQVPLAKALRKRPGRREFLRARLNAEGCAERFRSEGSGLISGLRWSGGLVELAEDCVAVEAGEPVAFIPYSSFGIPE